MRNVLVLVLVLAALGAGCSRKPRTEEEQYADLRTSVKYRSYTAISKKAVPPLVKVYDEGRGAVTVTAEKLPPLEEPAFRLILGAGWAVSQKADFAIAESHILEDLGGPPFSKALACSVRAIGFHEKGWRRLASAESSRAVTLTAAPEDRERTKLYFVAGHLLLGTHCLYEKDFPAARANFASFESLSGMDWPVDCVDILADAESGKVQSCLVRSKALSKKESAPKEVREALASVVAEVEKKNGPVESNALVPRMIASYAFDELKRAGKAGAGKAMELVDRAKGSF